MLYAFSIPDLSGKGTRVYALLQFQLARDLDVWVKYGITSYRNVDTIGSGLETREGPTRSDVKAQVRYKFELKVVGFTSESIRAIQGAQLQPLQRITAVFYSCGNNTSIAAELQVAAFHK